MTWSYLGAFSRGPPGYAPGFCPNTAANISSAIGGFASAYDVELFRRVFPRATGIGSGFLPKHCRAAIFPQPPEASPPLMTWSYLGAVFQRATGICSGFLPKHCCAAIFPQPPEASPPLMAWKYYTIKIFLFHYKICRRHKETQKRKIPPRG